MSASVSTQPAFVEIGERQRHRLSLRSERASVRSSARRRALPLAFDAANDAAKTLASARHGTDQFDLSPHDRWRGENPTDAPAADRRPEKKSPVDIRWR